MSTLQKYIKLANLLDDLGHHAAAKIVDSFVQRASLELEMEKEVEVKEDEDDDDGEEKETKKKKITLSFD